MAVIAFGNCIRYIITNFLVCTFVSQLSSLRSGSAKTSRFSLKWIILTGVIVQLFPVLARSETLRLSWKDNSSNESGFRIERSVDASNFSQIAQVGPNVTEFVDTGLSPSTQYWYRVRAFNSAGNSGFTNLANASTEEASATPPPSDNPPPSPPPPPSGGGSGSGGGSSSGGGGSGGGSSGGGAAPVNRAPTITSLSDVQIDQGESSDLIGFTIWDDATSSRDLVVGAWSSDTQLVPNDSIDLIGNFSNRKLQITPVPGRNGETVITVLVSDGEKEVEEDFKLLVNQTESPPHILVQPLDTNVLINEEAILFVEASGLPDVVYQWHKGDEPISEARSSEYRIDDVNEDHAGEYKVVVSNEFGVVESSIAILSVNAPPSILAEPNDVVAFIGDAVSLSIDVEGSPSLEYQWYFNGSPLAGAIRSIFAIPNSAAKNVGVYKAKISNEFGEAFSRDIILDLMDPIEITVQPESQDAKYKQTVELSVVALGESLDYQWYQGVKGDISSPVVGAVGSRLEIRSIETDSSYWVRVSKKSQLVDEGFVFVDSETANLILRSNESCLTNISIRAAIDEASESIMAGFVITGSGSKTALIRAIGPGLGDQGLNESILDPLLTIYRLDVSGSFFAVAQNDDWLSDDVIDATVVSGAFPLVEGAKDSAVLVNLLPGTYGAQVTCGENSTGQVLVELYDVSESVGLPNTCSISNFSIRSDVQGESNAVIAGFVVSGDEPKRFLVRAVGPELLTTGVDDFNANPMLQIYRYGDLVASVDNWNSLGGDISSVSSRVGAFPLDLGSKSSAITIWLEPGVYGAVATGRDGESGTTLVEVYDGTL